MVNVIMNISIVIILLCVISIAFTGCASREWTEAKFTQQCDNYDGVLIKTKEGYDCHIKYFDNTDGVHKFKK